MQDLRAPDPVIGKGTKHRQGKQPTVWDQVGLPPMTQRTALKALTQLGPVVYAVSYGPMIKIGWTGSIHRRLTSLSLAARNDGYNDVSLLAFRFGTRADETAIHHQLAASIAQGREYFHPTAEVLDLLAEWRADLGV